MIPLKSLRFQWLYVGLPGTGKSFAIRHDLWAEAQRTGGYIIAHDPNDCFEDDSDPNPVPCAQYMDPGALAMGVGKQGGSVVHILRTHDGDLVLRVALRLAAASRASAINGQFAPVYVYHDEAVASGTNRPHALSPLWMNVLASRRHLGIGVAMTAQSMYFAHRSVYMMATRLKIFRLPDPADAKRLVAAGLDPELAEQLRELPDFSSFEIVNGRTIHRPANGTAEILAPVKVPLQAKSEVSESLERSDTCETSTIPKDSPSTREKSGSSS